MELSHYVPEKFPPNACPNACYSCEGWSAHLIFLIALTSPKRNEDRPNENSANKQVSINKEDHHDRQTHILGMMQQSPVFTHKAVAMQIDQEAHVSNSPAPVLPGQLPVVSAGQSSVPQAAAGQRSSLTQSHAPQRSCCRWGAQGDGGWARKSPG